MPVCASRHASARGQQKSPGRPGRNKAAVIGKDAIAGAGMPRGFIDASKGVVSELIWARRRRHYVPNYQVGHADARLSER